MFVLAPVALNGTLTGGLPAFHALGACVTFAQAYAATIMKSEKTELVFNITCIQGVRLVLRRPQELEPAAWTLGAASAAPAR